MKQIAQREENGAADQVGGIGGAKRLRLACIAYFGGTLTTNFGQACMLYVRNLESCSRFMVGKKRPAILTGSAVGKCEVQVGAVDGEGQERDQHGHRHTARDIERAEHLGTGVLQVAATAAITAHRANVRGM